MQLAQSISNGLEHDVPLGIFEWHNLNRLEQFIYMMVTHLTGRLLFDLGSIPLAEGWRLDLVLYLSQLIGADTY